MIKYIINPDNTFGGAFTNLEDGVNYTELEPKKSTDLWNGSIWIDNDPIIVPEHLSRMKFIMQVFITTGIKYEFIVAFINELPVEVLDDDSKYLVLTRLRGCTHFERYSQDLLMISQMMGITQEQLDEIFINGNLIV